MSPEEFNEWRRKNDLPKLFDFFYERLPKFGQWVNEYFPNSNYIIQQNFTGKFISNVSQMIVVTYIEQNGVEITHIIPKDHWIYKGIRKRQVKIIENREFVPYIQWAQRQYENKPFIPTDKLNTSYTDDIEFMSWSDSMGIPTESIAKLFHDFELLPLGSCIIDFGVIINGRNLDFINLDHLEIRGLIHGSSGEYISYSSCRKLKLFNTDHAFITFNKCYIESLEIEKSRLQDFEFNLCKIIRPKLINSYFNGLRIVNSSFTEPIIRGCEIYGFELKLDNKIKVLDKFDTYRRVRTAFQQAGDRENQRYYYYLERVSERKTLWNPYSKVRQEFPVVPLNGSLLNLLIQFKELRKGLIWKYLKQILSFKTKIYFNHKYLFKLINYRMKFIGSLLESLLWGYGERPFRPIRNSIIIIFFYSILYYFSNNLVLANSLINSFYFSVVTFTTLGFGDISPGNSNYLKLLASSEALIGAITMGFLIAGLANRSKY